MSLEISKKRGSEWLVVFATIAYCFTFAFQGWMPQDEGLLAQEAERVLRGQIPHRDFDELYTGGLAWLHALSFHFLGAKLSSLRITLFAFFTVFLLAAQRIVLRVARPWAAALAIATCAAWGLPVYFFPLPSWYNLFFAGFGMYFLIRQIERPRASDLVLAGVMAGFSFDVKVTGVYFLIAGVLFLAYQEAATAAQSQSPSGRGALFFPKLILALIVTLFLLVLLSPRLEGSEAIHFLLPGVLVAFFPVLQEVGRVPAGTFPLRFKRLLQLQLPFLLGFALPVAGLLLYFAWHGSLHELMNGLFVLPRTRYKTGIYLLPSLKSLLTFVPFLILLVASHFYPREPSKPASALIAGFLGWLLFPQLLPITESLVWSSVRLFVPVLTIAGLMGLCRNRRKEAALPILNLRVYLLISAMAFVSLIQFPYSNAAYFSYVAPLVVICAVALLERFPVGFKRIHFSVLIFYLVFGLVWVDRADHFLLGEAWLPREANHLLLPERVGVVVPSSGASDYEALVGAIQTHSGPSPFIYAGPNSPEVYFLSGKLNPTRALNDSYIPVHVTPDTILKLIEEHHIAVAVLNTKANLSRLQLDPTLFKKLKARFPNSEKIADFEVLYDGKAK